MKKHYKFERGLGKDEIQPAPIRCSRCKKSGVTLFRREKKGKKVYICGGCRR